MIKETVNKFEIRGRIGGIARSLGRPSRFFVNAYINKRDVNLLITTRNFIPDDIKDGDHVVVKGYISVKPVEFRRADEHYKQLFFATEIRHDESVMEKEFGTEGKYYPPDYFLAAFQGTVTKATKTNENWGKLTIMTDVGRLDRQPSRIALDYQLASNRYASLPEFDYKIGDNVRVICSVTTSENEYDGQKVFYQNLKVEDIQKITPSGKVRVEAFTGDDEDSMAAEAQIEEVMENTVTEPAAIYVSDEEEDENTQSRVFGSRFALSPAN